MKALIFFVLLITIPFVATSQNRHADSLILVDIYNQLDGPNWNNPDNWLTDQPLELWTGVTIDNDRVSEIALINQNVAGTFPMQIIDLDQLNTFEINKGAISGTIPEELIQLNKLSRFVLSGIGMIGEVPNIFTQFENLQYLVLSNNKFEGSLPDIPDGMLLFYAERNNFSGHIPDSWANVILSNVNIADNELTGTLDIFETWTILSKMNFSDNDWDPGPLPMWLDTKMNLNSFSCKNCNFEGGIPAGFDLRDNLVHEKIVIDGNNIGGDVAALFIGPNSDKKMYLSIRGNKFSGNFPAHLVHSAASIDIQNNNFTSLTPFPDDVSFGTFEIQYNKLNYESLEPVQKYIELDSIINVRYNNMQYALTVDTIIITEPTTVTILAGDNHPNTTYSWVGPTVQGLTESMVNVSIDEFSNDATFQCFMQNETFPDLSLRRNKVVIIKDFSTSVIDRELMKVNIYPNPTNDHIQIELLDKDKTATFSLIENDGRHVSTGSVSDSKIINMQHLNAGIYHLKLQIGTQILTKYIIKL